MLLITMGIWTADYFMIGLKLDRVQVFIEIEDSDHEQEKIYGTDQFASST